MLLDLAIVGTVLAVGNWRFRRFDPFLPGWKRVLKTVVALLLTAGISYYFATVGVLIAIGVIMIPLVYVHAYWLPRHGVNGWTAEPVEKYYALRGWTKDGRRRDDRA